MNEFFQQIIVKTSIILTIAYPIYNKPLHYFNTGIM